MTRTNPRIIETSRWRTCCRNRIIGAVPGLREAWDREEREIFLSYAR
jgi:hypothetical protein